MPLQLPRLLQHGRSQIDTSCVPHYTGEPARQQPRPAGDIQNGILSTRAGQFDNPIERFLIADRRRA